MLGDKTWNNNKWIRLENSRFQTIRVSYSKKLLALKEDLNSFYIINQYMSATNITQSS